MFYDFYVIYCPRSGNDPLLVEGNNVSMYGDP